MSKRQDEGKKLSLVSFNFQGVSVAVGQIDTSEKPCAKSPHSPLRRSYSDSELPSMVSTTEVENGSQECLLQLTHLPTRGELLSESLVSHFL